jgi:RHS repeat-associated protein
MLDLVYNARVWQPVTISNGQRRMVFDIDDDWPAPGWTLGFGKLVRLGADAALIVDADGSRRPFLVDFHRPDGGLEKYWAHTTDGSGIKYTFHLTRDPVHRLHHGVLGRPDGSVIEFDAQSFDRHAVYPTRIIDADGNTLTIRYRASGAPAIDTITDTCGRVVKFLYDEVNLGVVPLVIRGPGPGPTGAEVDLVRFQYDTLHVQHTFVDPVLAEPGNVNLLTAVYFPATHTGYSQPLETYSGYGMLKRVRNCRGMSIAGPSRPDTGRILAGPVTWQRDFFYPDPGPKLADPPTYSMQTDTFTGQVDGPDVTTFKVDITNAGTTKSEVHTEVTHPDGSRTVSTSKNGLLSATAAIDADGTYLQQSVLDWQSADGAPQLRWTEVTNGRGDVARTVFEYGTASFPTVVDQYDSANTVARRTATQFVTDRPYLDRNLWNLPKVVTVYEPFDATNPVLIPAAITEYYYDETPRTPAPNLVSYDDRFVLGGPHYDPATTCRGNPTTIRRYADAVGRTGAIVETRVYDVCGNMRSNDLGVRRTEYQYHELNQYAAPLMVRVTNTSGTQAGAFVRARYMPNGALLWREDIADRTDDFEYDAAGRVYRITAADTKASVTFTHQDDRLTEGVTVRTGDGDIAQYELRSYDGAGHLTQLRRSTPSGLELTEYGYNRRGLLAGQAAPRLEQDPAVWSHLTYDGLGRIRQRDEPDGGSTRWHYDEQDHPQNASLATPGATVCVTDPSGRERWMLYDFLGRLREMVEPAPDGSGAVFPTGGLVISYDCDSLDNVTTIDMTDAAGATQQRRFKYDSLGRLERAYLPEGGTGITENGPAGAETWSTAWTYDDRSNVSTRQDSRGVFTIYEREGDALDRIHRVHYETKYFHDDGHPIVECPDVEYHFRTDGDPRHVSFSADGIYSEFFRYDDQDRLNSTGHGLVSAWMFEFEVGSPRDTLDRRTGTTYPARYGAQPAPAGPVVAWEYAIGGAMSWMTLDDAELVSEVAWDAGGRVSSMKVGAAGPNQVTETYAHEPPHLGVTGQTVTRQGDTLLDLTYHPKPATFGSATELTRPVESITGSVLAVDESRGYDYDALGRLKTATGETGASTWAQEYHYDTWGNRTTVTAKGHTGSGDPAPPDGTPSVAYSGTNNRVDGSGYEFDAAGNLARGPAADGAMLQYIYDAAGRLVYVHNESTQETIGYVYGECRRIRARLVFTAGGPWPPTDGPGIVWAQQPDRVASGTFYAWDGGHVIATYTDVGPQVGEALTWASFDVYRGERLLTHRERVDGGEDRSWYEHPGLTSTRLVTEYAGARGHDPFPFGAHMAVDGNVVHPFTSYPRDNQTGPLDYAVERHYDPRLGRFTQPDPSGAPTASQTPSQALNLYTYCAGDPVNYTDPLGLMHIVVCTVTDDDQVVCNAYEIPDMGTRRIAGGGGGGVGDSGGGGYDPGSITEDKRTKDQKARDKARMEAIEKWMKEYPWFTPFDPTSWTFLELTLYSKGIRDANRLWEAAGNAMVRSQSSMQENPNFPGIVQPVPAQRTTGPLVP